MSAILAMPHFQNTFHSGTTGIKVSIIFALYTVSVTDQINQHKLTDSGAMVGAPFAAVLSDRFGRRRGMFAGGFVIIIGMIIASTSHGVPQLVVGRFVLGFGIAIMTVAAPAVSGSGPGMTDAADDQYSIEIAPPHWRGRCTGGCLIHGYAARR